jgi:hypothetical protein
MVNYVDVIRIKLLLCSSVVKSVFRCGFVNQHISLLYRRLRLPTSNIYFVTDNSKYIILAVG